MSEILAGVAIGFLFLAIVTGSLFITGIAIGILVVSLVVKS